MIHIYVWLNSAHTNWYHNNAIVLETRLLLVEKLLTEKKNIIIIKSISRLIKRLDGYKLCGSCSHWWMMDQLLIQNWFLFSYNFPIFPFLYMIKLKMTYFFIVLTNRYLPTWNLSSKSFYTQKVFIHIRSTRISKTIKYINVKQIYIIFIIPHFI